MFSSQPINIFILINQINNHICGTIILFSISVSVAFRMSIKQFADETLTGVVSGNTYCWIFYHSLSLNLLYQITDGIGTSIFRLLYIKRGTWVKYKFGECSLLILIIFFNGLVTCLLMYGYSIENIASRSMYNTCMGYTQNYQVMMSFYKTIQRKTPIKDLRIIDRTKWILAAIEFVISFDRLLVGVLNHPLNGNPSRSEEVEIWYGL